MAYSISWHISVAWLICYKVPNKYFNSYENVLFVTSNTSPYKVESKYFTREHMDDSLTDFQETKQSCTGPKSTKTIVKQTKKASKRIKGQRDIRSVLKSKKNELVAYTKEFDTVCKKSGIDVDSEQLQIAIALSKSLQTEKNYEQVSPTSQDRKIRIRTTLQEYGFKVPEIKIANKKSKQYKKKHKLLATEETEKLQIISDRYSKVLFHNLDNSNTNTSIDNSKAFLYHITTNISYDQIKNNNIFYFTNFIEQSTSNYCLLRDWADIPGRPVSPKHSVTLKISFNEIKYSQEQLDLILSGSLKCTKNIVQSKYEGLINPAIIDKNTGNGNKTENNLVPELILDTDTTVIIKKHIDIKNLGDNTQGIMASQYRSCSPDIFDDDVSSLIDINKSTTCSQEKQENTDFMDLTECVNCLSQNSLRRNFVTYEDQPKAQLSQISDATKRKSNDFMEITKCVASSSQPVDVVNSIDLTQIRNTEETTAINSEKDKLPSAGFKSMDLTQSSDSSDDLPVVQLFNSNKNDLDNTITINADEYVGIINKTLATVRKGSTDEVLDITQNVQTKPINIHENNENFFGEFLHNHSDSKDLIDIKSTDEDGHLKCEKTIMKNVEIALTENKTVLQYLDNNRHHIGSDTITKLSLHETNKNNGVIINLNHSSSSSNKEDKRDVEVLDKSREQIDSENRSSLPDISKCSKNSDIDLTQSSNSTGEISDEVQEYIENENSTISCNLSPNAHRDSGDIDNNIDLTQSSNSSVELPNEIPETYLKTYNNSSLGKKDDVSIDYDELCNLPNQIEDNSKNNLINSCKSIVYEIIDENDSNRADNELCESSQNSEVFLISDRELDYSLHQYKHENFQFGGLSILNNFSSNPRFSKANENQDFSNILDVSKNYNILPEVDMKRKDYDINGTEDEVEAINKRSNEICNLIETPKNKDYIIKTENVTPMMDYASMSTPQRNKELDKYGLKPFKRKRAIQILTHLYNQTHPIVEPFNDDLTSPSKKLKRDGNHTYISPKKITKSPTKSAVQSGNSTDTILYEVTNELPDIKEVHCCGDDWVFQRKEKAKLHSCRVPLHIAFHNYVTCRRGLREAILRYEPVNIDIIHKELVVYGHRYDPKELLRFLDKKCITVKTTDNSARNNRY